MKRLCMNVNMTTRYRMTGKGGNTLWSPMYRVVRIYSVNGGFLINVK